MNPWLDLSSAQIQSCKKSTSKLYSFYVCHCMMLMRWVFDSNGWFFVCEFPLHYYIVHGTSKRYEEKRACRGQKVAIAPECTSRTCTLQIMSVVQSRFDWIQVTTSCNAINQIWCCSLVTCMPHLTNNDIPSPIFHQTTQWFDAPEMAFKNSHWTKFTTSFSPTSTKSQYLPLS